MEVADLLKAALGLVTGAIATYLGLYWKIREELVGKYDQELRAERVKQYTLLWQVTEPMAKYSAPSPVTESVLRLLGTALRKWYFSGGGMFMTDRARDAYFALQDSVTEAMASPTSSAASDAKVPDDVEESVRKKSSQLRTVLTADIGSRKKPLIDEASEA